jgi:hypothetical protein
MESGKRFVHGCLENIVLFTKTVYIQKEQIAVPKNDHAMRKSPGHFSSRFD